MKKIILKFSFLCGCIILFPAFGEVVCKKELGPRVAEKLVEWCLMVSPATHPPCNVFNQCGLILDEVVRGCLMLPEDEKPDYCKDVRSSELIRKASVKSGEVRHLDSLVDE